jgi:hypothetical protein
LSVVGEVGDGIGRLAAAHQLGPDLGGVADEAIDSRPVARLPRAQARPRRSGDPIT